MTLCKKELILPSQIILDKERTIHYLHQGITKELLTSEDRISIALAYMSLLASVPNQDELELMLIDGGLTVTQSRKLRSLAYCQVDSMDLLCS
ncbi:hypothetical protein LIS04_173 [Listeria phage LIS04]|nr:hypothetical protein LIS04_173 [Listeria phage LIS04]